MNSDFRIVKEFINSELQRCFLALIEYDSLGKPLYLEEFESTNANSLNQLKQIMNYMEGALEKPSLIVDELGNAEFETSYELIPA